MRLLLCSVYPTLNENCSFFFFFAMKEWKEEENMRFLKGDGGGGYKRQRTNIKRNLEDV